VVLRGGRRFGRRTGRAVTRSPGAGDPPQRAGTIGRSPGCGVSTPEDIYTSTLHARLFRRNEQLWVEDLGSTNGTYVNSERISKAVRLGKGDMLQIGSTVFEVSR